MIDRTVLLEDARVAARLVAAEWGSLDTAGMIYETSLRLKVDCDDYATWLLLLEAVWTAGLNFVDQGSKVFLSADKPTPVGDDVHQLLRRLWMDGDLHGFRRLLDTLPATVARWYDLMTRDTSQDVPPSCLFIAPSEADR